MKIKVEVTYKTTRGYITRVVSTSEADAIIRTVGADLIEVVVHRHTCGPRGSWQRVSARKEAA